MVKTVAVFCGSRLGVGQRFSDVAEALGAGLARRGLTLVYGGGKSGLMGVVADAALKAGGDVIGVIPTFLHRREVMHEGVTDLIVTQSMHERKQIMFTRSDAFIILPGGIGTFDELIEILTWRQLGLHDKSIIILNQGGWADNFLATISGAVQQGFADRDTVSLYEVIASVDAVFDRLDASDTTPCASAARM